MKTKNKQALDALDMIEQSLTFGDDGIISPSHKGWIKIIRTALQQPTLGEGQIKGTGNSYTKPLVRTTVDDEGNEIVIMAKWYYDTMAKLIEDYPCETCKGDKEECAKVLNSRHCEKANRGR